MYKADAIREESLGTMRRSAVPRLVKISKSIIHPQPSSHILTNPLHPPRVDSPWHPQLQQPIQITPTNSSSTNSISPTNPNPSAPAPGNPTNAATRTSNRSSPKPPVRKPPSSHPRMPPAPPLPFLPVARTVLQHPQVVARSDRRVSLRQ